MALTLEQAIERVPGWSGAADLRTTPLGGGITNHNFRVDIGGESFVLRLVGENTGLLGIDRRVELAANRAAAAIGIAPPVHFFIEPEGCLVTRFIDGRPVEPEAIGRPEMIERVMQALRRVHALPAIPGDFSAHQVVADYGRLARQRGVGFPADFAALTAGLERLRRALPALEPVPCHNDLLNANFLDDGRLWILDWEYAGMGDRYFDLANFSRNHDFEPDQDRQVLHSYFGEATPARFARLRLMRVASDMREAMWGLLQSGISELDFDFGAYADKHFRRAADGMADPEWDAWLKEAAHGS